MLMSDVLIWVAIATGFVVSLPALWMLTRGLWPEASAKRLEISRNGVFASFIAGLVPILVFSFIIAVLGKRLGPVPGILVSGSVLALGLSGLTGYASLIGERLWANAEIWRQTRNGGLVIICCALLPVVGWFLLLPIFVIIGMGVSVRSFLSKSAVPAASHAEA